jgi:hypothetical protein
VTPEYKKAAGNCPGRFGATACGTVDLVPAAARRNQGPLAQGILTMTVFGLGWAVVGVTGLFGSPAGRVAGYLRAAVVAGAVAVAALRSPPGRVHRRSGSANPGRDFGLVNLAQGVLILVAVLAFGRAGHPVLIAPAACLVVGLHFLPLARVFGIPLYRSTGAVLIAIAVIGFVLFAADVSVDGILVTVGLAAAVTLWCTSLLLPRYARVQLPRPAG